MNMASPSGCLPPLSNGVLDLTAVAPGAPGTYRGTRFSWAGNIAEVAWGEHHLFGPWQPGPLALDVHDNVSGTAGEFGMGIADNVPPPLGFDEAAPGECFVKIGVGILRRPDAKPYSFAGKYELVEAPAWEVTGEQRRIEMRQRLDFDGYGYDYTHTIELIPGASAFVTRHRLTNTGGKPILQAHYSHNFMVLDRQPVGPDHEVIVPFSPSPAFKEDSDAVVQGNRVGFRRPLKKAVFAMLAGFDGGVADNQFTIRNRRTGLAVKVTGDRPILRHHFFAAPGAVCPEPFVEIHAAPGETVTWCVSSHPRGIQAATAARKRLPRRQAVICLGQALGAPIQSRHRVDVVQADYPGAIRQILDRLDRLGMPVPVLVDRSDTTIAQWKEARSVFLGELIQRGIRDAHRYVLPWDVERPRSLRESLNRAPAMPRPLILSYHYALELRGALKEIGADPDSPMIEFDRSGAPFGIPINARAMAEATYDVLMSRMERPKRPNLHVYVNLPVRW